MKLAALILLLAIIGKISAHPVRIGYYRAAPPQQISSDEMDDEVADDDDDAEADVSDENNFQAHDIQDDDDDDDDEQEPPPNFSKLFPLASPNQPGYNYPLSSMMSEIGTQAWRVPKKPQNRGRNELRMESEEDDEQADDDDDDDDDSDEEDEEAEDDIPDWQALFPNQSEQGNGPPSDVIDSSSQPEIGAFRSTLPRSRVVYVPASQLQQGRAVYASPSYHQRQPQYPRRQYQGQQYIVRNPSPPRAPMAYSYIQAPAYGSRQPVSMRRRPQTVMMMASPSRRPQAQRQQQYYAYMPVRRNMNTYNPYVARMRRNGVPRISYN
ncbi:unnamed protein product [Orchesella dallaii]|uniref:Uncharacterized protein n=1 Tax=Orchesella dallaii TaxID=48710 RepID=A0ABP1QHV7_9HEXA